MENNYTIWGNMFLKDGKYRKIFNAVLIITGLLFGVYITDFSQWNEIGFFVTAYCLGVPCVITLGDRDGILGNVLGLASNVGEMAIFAYFGTWGMVISGFYFGIMHVVGLGRWNDKKNQASDGKVKITNVTKEQTIFTVVFFFIGLFLLLFFGEYVGFSVAQMGLPLYLANIVTFAISITSQLLMILAKKVSWIGWGASNFINFGINFVTKNYWFMIRDVIYQVNAVAAYYQWDFLEKKQNKEKAIG